MIKLKNIILEQDNKEQEITLYYKEGTSDKVYSVFLRQSGNGWIVNAQWGRRGSTMQTQTKTNSPESYESAKKIYDNLVNSKMAKGYEPGKDAPMYTSTSSGESKEKRNSGIHPQLLNPISSEDLEKYMTDDSYGAQEKYDGKRILININNDGVFGINKKGLTVEIPEEISSSVKSLIGIIIDGELVGDKYYVFDLLRYNNNDISTWSYKRRYLELEKIKFERNIILAPLAIGEQNKRRYYEILQKDEKEGIVFKDLSAPYKPGRPASGGTQVKFKFWESCSAVVSKINQKRSVAVQLYDEIGKNWIDVGNVSVPVNKEMPTFGDVVEIKYLYAYRGGSLYQPIYLGKRDDVDRMECKTSQLKYKK